MNPMTIDLVLTLMIQLLNRAAEFGTLITRARNEGRDITAAELDALVAHDDFARSELQNAINQAKEKP